jgi:serine/threonine-protein kinase/endoribonuclease IRE1
VPDPEAPAKPQLPYGPHRRPAAVAARVKGNLAGGTSVLVGALRGSLYALPADHLMLDALAGPVAALPLANGPVSTIKCTSCAPMSPPTALCLGGGETLQDAGGECPAEEVGAAVLVRDDDAPDDRGLVPLQPSGVDVAEEMGGLVCPHLPLGLYHLTAPGEGRPALPWLPASVQQGDEVGGGLPREGRCFAVECDASFPSTLDYKNQHFAHVDRC